MEEELEAGLAEGRADGRAAHYLRLRERIGGLARSELAPRAAVYDREGTFPWESVRRLADEGFFGIMVPPAYGGLGEGLLSYAICMEEIASACASTSLVWGVHNSLVAGSIVAHGTEEQKRRYLPLLARGEMLGAFCLTEPQAGSDAGAVTAAARREGSSYVLQGRKTFVTSGGVAGLYLIVAATDPAQKSRGLTAFLVEKDRPGLSFGPPLEKMGLRAAVTTDLFLEDCRVPEENRLGAEGQGFKIALSALDRGRVGIAAQAVGIARAAFQASLDYAGRRQQFGQALTSFQGIQWKLADMATEIEAARLLCHRAARLADRGERFTREAAQAKLFATGMAVRCCTEASQIHGGYGYLRDYTVERFLRDVKVTEIYEGTSEIMRNVIAGHLIPRDSGGGRGR
ncbi:MAG TPA: acyl-CoA dehydrogenase [Firmicutes bacterium]|nr:acyl-CoA dehydrogenase [Bacillota bacterium]